MDEVLLINIGMMIIIILIAGAQLLILWDTSAKPAPAINVKVEEDTPLYERVIKRFAETHSYNVTDYNCVNYSEDLGKILEHLGYQVSYEIYKVNETASHMVINVDLEVEPQTAEVIINRNNTK